MSENDWATFKVGKKGMSEAKATQYELAPTAFQNFRKVVAEPAYSNYEIALPGDLTNSMNLSVNFLINDP